MSSTTITLTISTVIESAIGGDVSGYAALSTGDKSRVRSGLAEALRSTTALLPLTSPEDIPALITRTQAIMAAEVAVKSARTVSAPVDQTDRAIGVVLAHLGAALAIADRDNENVDSARLSDAVTAWLAAPTVSDAALKIASGVTFTRGARVTDVGAHLRQVAAQHESGTFLTVAQVAGTVTDECPNGYPHQGAIAARLFPTSGTCTVSEVVPAPATSTQPRGMIVA